MDIILVFSETIDLKNSYDAEIRYIYSRAELARTLVSEENIRCLVADLPELTEEYVNFFTSVKINFPMLEGAVLTSETEKTIRGYKIISRKGDNYISELGNFIENSQNRNKRGANRFSWPLTAWFSEDDVDWHELEIFSVSSGGAYLKTDEIFPELGSKARVKINFANFSLESGCEIVDSQSRSSSYPFGFSIKFTSISEGGILVLNKLINDAVIKILMEPESDPEIPSIGGSDLTPDFTFI